MVCLAKSVSKCSSFNHLPILCPGQRNATSQFNIVHHHWMQHVELVWLPCCLSCCMMLYNVKRSMISIKHLMQHRSTFLHLRMRCKSSLMQGERVGWPKIRDHYSSQIFNLHNSGPHRTCCIRLATQYNTIQQSWIQQCWMMLHSFGHGFSTGSCLKQATSDQYKNSCYMAGMWKRYIVYEIIL